MMHALLAWVLACQDPEILVSGRARKVGGEFELTLAGKGATLADQSIVSLGFHPRTIRVNWNTGALETAAAEEGAGRCAYVEKGAFVHRERFPGPGEVEVRFGFTVSGPEGRNGDRELRRVFRIGTAADAVGALRGSMRKMETSLAGARAILEDAEVLMTDPCLSEKRRREVRKRLDWRLTAYREEVAGNSLAAAAHAFLLFLADVESALDAELSGKVAATVSALTGAPFAWEQAREQISAIGALAQREQALIMTREAEALRKEIVQAAVGGDEALWTRAEKGFRRGLEALVELDRETRGGASGGRFEEMTRLEDVTLGGLLGALETLIHSGAALIICPAGADGKFEEQQEDLAGRLDAFDRHFRRQK